jgi:predicted metalloendopeptidase
MALAAGAGFAQTTPSDQKPILGDWGIETQFISKDIKPGDDFYRYVNEGWLQTATPPAGYPFSNAFVDATVRTQAQLRELIDSILASDPTPGSDEALLGAFYESYMDVARRNALGLTPLQPQIDAIAALETHEDVARMMGQAFMASFVSAGVGTDVKNPDRYVVKLSQSGIGLPSPAHVRLQNFLRPVAMLGNVRISVPHHWQSSLTLGRVRFALLRQANEQNWWRRRFLGRW